MNKRPETLKEIADKLDANIRQKTRLIYSKVRRPFSMVGTPS